jgi:hypothetical protein
MLRRETHNFGINGLFARQPCLTQEPPHRWLEPQQSTRDFFKNCYDPILAANV